MRFGSVCSGIKAASCAWHPLGWRAEFLSEILDGLANLGCGFSDRVKVISRQSPGVRKSMAVWAKDDAIGKCMCAAFASLDYVVSVARCFIPSAAHALVSKYPAQSFRPTAPVGVDLALGEYIGLPFVPRGASQPIPSVFGKRINGRWLPRMVAFYESARSAFLIHGRHFAPTPALTKTHGDNQSFSVLMALQVFPWTSIGPSRRNDRSATAFANLGIHSFSLLIG